MFETHTLKHVATCPSCGAPHNYSVVKHPVENDWGHWLTACYKCGSKFAIRVKNPNDSDPGDCVVIERFDDDTNPYDGDAPGPGASAVHNLNMNLDHLRFDPQTYPIYRCVTTDDPLEQAAFDALKAEWGSVRDQLGDASNQMLARSQLPAVEHTCIRIDFACECGDSHRATFYRPFRLDGSTLPEVEEMLLADVTGTDLDDALSGIVTKTEAMDALEKLIARWRLFNDQVLILTPFVAYQWKKQEERLAIWERLLSQLDATRTVLLTRGKTYKEYTTALAEAGLEHDVLARFGLENRVVGDGKRKEHSHAKVYIGLGATSEVFSGSANIVDGPSDENMSFKTMPYSNADKRYVAKFGVKLPAPRARLANHLMVEIRDGAWRWDLPRGAAPEK